MPMNPNRLSESSRRAIADSQQRQAVKFAANRLELTCLQCGNSFVVIPARAHAKYCSMRCYGDAKRGTIRVPRVQLTCDECGCGFERKPSEARKRGLLGYFCSPECSSVFHSRRGAERRDAALSYHWRGFVLDRDGHRCQSCGATGQLEAHHIKPWATFPAGRYDPANGITLCEPCHDALHYQSKPVQMPLTLSVRFTGTDPFSELDELP